MAEMEEREKMLADPSLQRKNAEHFESQANETQMDTPSSAEKSEKDGLAETPDANKFHGNNFGSWRNTAAKEAKDWRSKGPGLTFKEVCYIVTCFLLNLAWTGRRDQEAPSLLCKEQSEGQGKGQNEGQGKSNKREENFEESRCEGKGQV